MRTVSFSIPDNGNSDVRGGTAAAAMAPQWHVKGRWSNPDRGGWPRPIGGNGRSRRVDLVTHYLRTFEHLAPTDKVAPPRPQRRRISWVALSVLAALTLLMVRRPHHEAADTAE